MSAKTTLSAASNDRKARLAQLQSLKRKQASDIQNADEQPKGGADGDDQATVATSGTLKRKSRSPSPQASSIILSGRNYDPETRGPKLGFENAPVEGQATIESQAKRLAEETKRLQEEEDKADKPLDLFKLQPKKPNWDLKRDLERKLEVLNVRTDNAIARLVRDRIQKAQTEARAAGDAADGENVGMEGNTLVEAMHMREREEEADERREREEEAEEGFT